MTHAELEAESAELATLAILAANELDPRLHNDLRQRIYTVAYRHEPLPAIVVPAVVEKHWSE